MYVFVVGSYVRLGAGRKDWRRELARFLQARGHRYRMYGSRFLVFRIGRSGEIPSDDGLAFEDLAFLDKDGPTFELVPIG